MITAHANYGNNICISGYNIVDIPILGLTAFECVRLYQISVLREALKNNPDVTFGDFNDVSIVTMEGYPDVYLAGLGYGNGQAFCDSNIDSDVLKLILLKGKYELAWSHKTDVTISL